MIYKIIMSRGEAIKIDEEDLRKLTDNIGEKLVRLKQGIINPSFMISIVPTDEEDVLKIPIIDTTSGVAKITGYTETLKLKNII